MAVQPFGIDVKTYRTIEEALEAWDIEETIGDPRFSFKHAIRLQGLFLEQDNTIYDHRGQFYAKLESVKWKDAQTLEARVKVKNQAVYSIVTIDIGKLK